MVESVADVEWLAAGPVEAEGAVAGTEAELVESPPPPAGLVVGRDAVEVCTVDGADGADAGPEGAAGEEGGTPGAEAGGG